MSAPCIIKGPVHPQSGEVTRLLQRLADGDKDAGNELAPHIYKELHELAAYCLRREKPGHTWQTTDLVNEAYVKLVGGTDIRFCGRSHFFGVASKIMRHILTDYARRKKAEKRGGKAKIIPLDDSLVIADEQCEMIANLEAALQRLEGIDPKAAKVVELRFFGGRNEEEIALVMGVSVRTVKRLWQTARAWLFGQIISRKNDSRD